MHEFLFLIEAKYYRYVFLLKLCTEWTYIAHDLIDNGLILFVAFLLTNVWGLHLNIGCRTPNNYFSPVLFQISIIVILVILICNTWCDSNHWVLASVSDKIILFSDEKIVANTVVEFGFSLLSNDWKKIEFVDNNFFFLQSVSQSNFLKKSPYKFENKGVLDPSEVKLSSCLWSLDLKSYVKN